MQYYHDLVTDMSFQELGNLRRLTDFVLIGGWAVYYYTKQLKSKDIDIIIDYPALSIIQDKYTYVKNVRLRKYEAVKQEVQIDIYVPYYSNIGIPVEDLISKTTKVSGYTLLELEYLFALKLYTLSERGRKPKGRKDFLDLLTLILIDKVDFDKVKQILKKYSLAGMATLKQFLRETQAVRELNLNSHAMAKLKKKIEAKLS